MMIDDVDGLMARFNRWSRITAEMAGLSWQRDGKRIQALSIELNEVEAAGPLFRRDTASPVMPLYRCIDEDDLCGAFTTERIDDVAYAAGLLDLFAERCCSDCAVPIGFMGKSNWHTMLHFLGDAVVPSAMLALRDALAGVRPIWVRLEITGWPIDDDGDEIVGKGEPHTLIAPIDTTDDRFEEAGFTDCDASDEHARRVWRTSIDDALLEPLCELVKVRGRAARAALMGMAA